MTPSSYREQALACIDDDAHPASLIESAAFVDGALERDNSFMAGVISSAQLWRERYEIVGAYAVGETLVEPTGVLADALGLASPGLRTTRASRSKYLQRWYAAEHSPASIVIGPAQRGRSLDAVTSFPAVVKPASRHSSSGVETVSDAAQLRERLASFPAHETILVEEKVVGPEFSVESLVQDGRIVFASATRKQTTESHAGTFVELSHTVPSERIDLEPALLRANRELLERLAFEDGIAHAEWRVDRTGRPVLMEIAARTPGDGLTVLYQLATGVPLEPEIVRIALREPARYPAPRRYARQLYLEHDEGVLEEVSLDWPGVQPQWIGEAGLWPQVPAGAADAPPTLRAVLVLKDRGSELGPLRSSDDRAVTLLFDAPTPQSLDALEQRVREAIVITTTSVARSAAPCAGAAGPAES